MSKGESIIDEAAVSLLRDLTTGTDIRDQNASILRDRLRAFGLDGSDPATVRGVLAGVLILREQLQVIYGIAGAHGLLLVPGGDLFNVPEVLTTMESASVMVDQHRRAGR
jgi:hypothetical protein